MHLGRFLAVGGWEGAAGDDHGHVSLVGARVGESGPMCRDMREEKHGHTGQEKVVWCRRRSCPWC